MGTIRDAAVNMATPDMKTLPFPSQSPALPAIRTVEASAIKKELATQLTSAKETLNSSAMAGKAIAMEDVVKGVIKDAIAVAIRTLNPWELFWFDIGLNSLLLRIFMGN